MAAAAAARQALMSLPQAHIDPLSDELCVMLPAQTWEMAAQIALREGFDTCEFITAADMGEHLRIVVMLADAAAEKVMFATTLVADGALEIPSLSQLLPGATWHERETAEMFGVVFTGHPDPRPLLLHDCPAVTPLRKHVALTARTGTPWPGAAEPPEAQPGRRPRRQQLPPGVRPDWVAP